MVCVGTLLDEHIIALTKVRDNFQRYLDNIDVPGAYTGKVVKYWVAETEVDLPPTKTFVFGNNTNKEEFRQFLKHHIDKLTNTIERNGRNN